MKLRLAAILCFISLSVAAQHVLSGKVVTTGEAVPFANVFLKSISQGTVADENGHFTIGDLEAGSYALSVSAMGYETVVVNVAVPGTAITIELQEADLQLREVVVEGKTDTRLAMEQPIKAAVINTKVFSRQPSTMIELMNRSAGVRVRQTGGLGASATLSLNGFQDKAIKYFKDGIPMDYLGAGYNFSLVPVNMLERVEIYKGVLPVSLGADALGGGLNLVSKKSFRRYAEASYEVASFNTHRLSLNAFYRDTSAKYFIGGDAFFNYSDNDYQVNAPVVDAETATTAYRRVRLFHNRFKQYYGELYGGVMNTRWADELRVGLTAFDIDRENQYGARMNQPFGAAVSRQHSVIPTVRYQKTFFDDRFSVDQFLVANTIVVEQVDTVKGTYNWFGEFIPSDSRRGEVTMRGSLADVEFSIFTARTHLAYAFSDHHRLAFNAVITRLSRVGSDPLGMTFKGSGRDVLSVPAYYDKSVASVGLESHFLDERLTNNLIVKHYNFTTEAVDGDYYGNELDRSASKSNWGLANAIKLETGDNAFVRLSAEAATRLPEQQELFGDGNFHVSNFELKPERSVNINAGYRLSKGDRFFVELNSFYRITHDLILNVPYNIVFNQHQNVENVKGIGLEADASFTILDGLRANGNFTYQDFRLFDTDNATNEGSRLRNTPWFFANLGLNASRRNLFGNGDKVQAYWYYTFVRQYYLDYIPKDREPEGFLGLWGEVGLDARNVIPDQNLHTAGLTYFPFNDRFSCGFQIKNIFDAEVFDNFRIQNAGRSYHLKLTYILK